MPEREKFDLSLISIIKAVIVVGFFLLLYAVRDIVALLFIVLIFVAACRPIVKSWGQKIGKITAILILFALFVAIAAGFVYLIIPPLIIQTKELISNVPQYYSQLSYLRSNFPIVDKAIQSIPSGFGAVSSSLYNITTSFIGGLVAFFTIIVLTIYLLLDDKFIENSIKHFVPEEKRASLLEVFRKVYRKIGEWIRGQLLLGLIMGTLTFIALSIAGLPYALTLGIIAGVLEFIPVVGPIIAGAFAALVALTISPLMVLIVVAISVVLQQLENNLIVPNLMKKAVGLPPFVIIVAVLIGGKLLGIVGAILAIPITASLFVLAQEWQVLKKIFDR